MLNHAGDMPALRHFRKGERGDKSDFIGTWSRCRGMMEGTGAVFLQRDRFDPLDFFAGERELFGLEVFFHVLSARGAGQREHADLLGKAKDDLCDTGA